MSSDTDIGHVFFEESIKIFNLSRLSFLDKLNLNFESKTILEPGAGPGVFTRYLLDQDASVTVLEARQELVNYNQLNNPTAKCIQFDLESTDWTAVPTTDIAFVYGVLYHLSNPFQFIDYLHSKIKEYIVIETVVKLDNDQNETITVPERQHHINQSFSGIGCRPTRKQLYDYLKTKFPYVYLTKSQPNNVEFPCDFNHQYHHTARFIIIGSNIPLINSELTEEFILVYTR